MALSRSDMGMVAILGFAAIGFFVFSARSDERKAQDQTTKKQGKGNAEQKELVPEGKIVSKDTNAVKPVIATKTVGATIDKTPLAHPVTTQSVTTQSTNRKTILKSTFPVEFDEAGVVPVKVNMKEVKQTAQQFKGCKNGITLVGHTDEYGSKKRNEFISLERARSVKKILIQQGMDENLIHISGAGAKTPTAPNESAQGRHFNRRVDIACGKEE